MEIKLSWNLFIGGFFAVILAYSFIIGKNQTLKIIIATYLAAFATDGLSNLALAAFQKYSPVAQTMPPELQIKYYLVFKLALLIALMVLIVIKGDFTVNLIGDGNVLIGLLTNVVFGVLSAGLLISAVMVFMSGGSFLNAVAGDLQSEQMALLLQESRLARIMVNNYNLWFAAPALALLLESIWNRRKNA